MRLDDDQLFDADINGLERLARWLGMKEDRRLFSHPLAWKMRVIRFIQRAEKNLQKGVKDGHST